MKTYLKITLVLFLSLLILSQCTYQSRRNRADKSGKPNAFDRSIRAHADDLFAKGKAVFRFETFGDEAFWTDQLQLHRAIADSKHGGIGAGLSPKKALELGLKVDLDIVPGVLKRKIRQGNFLDDPWVSLQLIKANAVLGVVGTFDGSGNLVKVGVTCAICHSTVDNPTGIGSRLDGWPNRDLNVGAIIALAPDLSVYEKLLDQDVATIKQVLNSWGPGKFDAQLNLDGKAFRPDGKSGATLIPEAFGHAGHNLHTWTGGWGNITYWNAFVANLEMSGQGRFYDPRLMDPKQFPVAAKAGFGNKMPNDSDHVTGKLAALQFYQLSIPAPAAPDTLFDKEAAGRGAALFIGKAKCATCHVPPLFSEPGWNTHTPEEICIDDFQAKRSPEGTYVTQGLKGLWTHMKGGFYHDGRFATLMDVVNHYDDCKNLSLTDFEKRDLVEYLKSL